ncbi:MAG: NUDIX domain-containing protein [Pseudomonadota bacterium]
MRRIGEPWLAGKPYRDRPGVYGIIAGGDGMLLLVNQEGELQLPGGGIDPGENPLQALHREVREETGWRIAEPVRMTAFQRYAWLPDYKFWARKVQAIYVARAVRDLRTEREPGHLPVWMPPALAARHLDVEGDRVMVVRAIRLGLI